MRVVSTVGFACLLVACTNQPGELTGSARQPIIGGTASSADQDFVVELVSLKNGEIYEECTGTLVAKNLLLTARHCVGELQADQKTMKDFAAQNLAVYKGRDAQKRVDANAKADARGTKVFTTGLPTMIPDVALVLLDTAVTGVAISKIRLDGGTKKGEKVDIVGYGYDERAENPITRMQKTGLTVLDIGPIYTQPELIAGEFMLGEGACSGDSGGPALSSDTGAVVGVVSRVNGVDSATDPVAFCKGTDARPIYTSLVRVKDEVLKAFEAAGTQPYLENDTAPPVADGAEPTSADEPADEASKPASPARKSLGPAPASSGCAMGGGATSDSASNVAIVALGLAAALSSRRRART